MTASNSDETGVIMARYTFIRKLTKKKKKKKKYPLKITRQARWKQVEWIELPQHLSHLKIGYRIMPLHLEENLY